jgi:hypothetical protein
MKWLKVITCAYLLVATTVVTGIQLSRQSQESKELHDYRAVELQMRLYHIQHNVHCEGT